MAVEDTWRGGGPKRGGGIDISLVAKRGESGPERGSSRQKDYADWERKMNAYYATEQQTRKPSKRSGGRKRNR